MIQIQNLQVHKAGQRICSVPALEIPPGEHLVVTGGNGAGKSTFLRVLSGLESSYQGDCRISIPVKNRVFVHQTPYLFRGTVEFNVCYGLKSRGVNHQQRGLRFKQYLELFGLTALINRRIETLSGGECRRVALARGFILQPELLLLDEPLAELDEAGIDCVSHALLEHSKSTIVLTSPLSLANDISIREYSLDPTK